MQVYTFSCVFLSKLFLKSNPWFSFSIRKVSYSSWFKLPGLLLRCLFYSVQKQSVCCREVKTKPGLGSAPEFAQVFEDLVHPAVGRGCGWEGVQDFGEGALQGPNAGVQVWIADARQGGGPGDEALQAEGEILQLFVQGEEAGGADVAVGIPVTVPAGTGIAAGTCHTWKALAVPCLLVTASWLCATKIALTAYKHQGATLS